MTISTNLTSLATAKSNIKSAIENKGVDLTAIPFTDYHTKISEISTGTPIPEWVRPSDWLEMPEVLATEQKIVGLFPVFEHESNGVSIKLGSGNYTVDWGDGIIQDFNAGVTASRKFDYGSISNATLCSRGYKQVLITITPQSGNNLTYADFGTSAEGDTAGGTYRAHNWLDLIISLPNLSSSVQLITNVSASADYWPLCERFSIIAHHPSGVSISLMFSNFLSLQELPVFPVAGTNALSAFSNCRALKKLGNFNFSGITNATAMFGNCSSLQVIPDTFGGSAFTGTALGMFQYCDNLKAIPPSLSNARPTSTELMFRNCKAITTVPYIDCTAATSISNMFNGCNNLEELKVNVTASCANFSYAFQNCLNLRKVTVLGTCTGVTNYSYMFDGCMNLESINAFQTPAIGNVAYMFQNCHSLTEIPAFVWPSSTLSSTNIFQYCHNLASIKASGLSNTITIYGKLGPNALTELYKNLKGPVSGKSITVSANYGAATSSIANCTTGTYSTTVSTVNTANIKVGQLVIGSWVNTAVPITFNSTTNRVNKYLHGLPNGRRVAFSTITTTTGIVAKVIYYVVNGDADGFNLSTSEGGAPIDLFNDGTGEMIYPTYVTAVNPGVSFSIDIGAQNAGTVTFVVRNDDISYALQKGWSVG